jgi:hypothetical protein
MTMNGGETIITGRATAIMLSATANPLFPAACA